MMITAQYDLQSVVMALAITTVCCGAIIIFSSQSCVFFYFVLFLFFCARRHAKTRPSRFRKYDLTDCMGFLFIASMVLLVFGLVAIISTAFFRVRFLLTVYAGLAALLFMVYLAVDVQVRKRERQTRSQSGAFQMIMGGRRVEISPEDHIVAAIQVFLDIVYIFWMLLSLFGSSK